MERVIEYKGCIGSVDYYESDNLFWGKLIGITDSISYQGADMDELRADFEDAVEDYFDACHEIGKEPTRIAGELYEQHAL